MLATDTIAKTHTGHWPKSNSATYCDISLLAQFINCNSQTWCFLTYLFSLTQ